jgi:hypothetical protein
MPIWGWRMTDFAMKYCVQNLYVQRTYDVREVRDVC